MILKTFQATNFFFHLSAFCFYIFWNEFRTLLSKDIFDLIFIFLVESLNVIKI